MLIVPLVNLGQVRHILWATQNGHSLSCFLTRATPCSSPVIQNEPHNGPIYSILVLHRSW